MHMPMESSPESAASHKRSEAAPDYTSALLPVVTEVPNRVQVPALPWTRRANGPASPASGIGQRAELTAASPTGQGIAVQAVKIPSGTGFVVVIKDSRGVQAGDHSRQLNNFKCRIDKPRVSLDDVLKGDAARLRAFQNLVEHPDSIIANSAFRRRMSEKTAPPGRVRFISTSAPRTVRVAARVDERGQVVVTGSRGVQAGSGVTQRNTFKYQAVRPDLSLEPLLRRDPQLARSLALTARYPDNGAVQRSFTGRLAQACAAPIRSSSGSSARLARTIGIEVNRADAVQFGHHNIRKDRIDVRIRNVVLTGWTRPVEATRSSAGPELRPRGSEVPRSGGLSFPHRTGWRGATRRPADRDPVDRSPGRPGAGMAPPAPADPPDRLGPPHRPGPSGPGGRF
jgi:hypothetical protein